MFDYTKLPGCVEGMRLYVEQGIRPGTFLSAVLKNDLYHALSYADDDNIKVLKQYAEFLCWELPEDAWGSKEKVNKWIAHRGLGETAEEDYPKRIEQGKEGKTVEYIG